jgi:Inner membrane protein YgaP-like, transmembrane domain
MNYRNLSTLDRAVRIVLGILMLAAAWSGVAAGIWKSAFEIFGWVPLATGVAGWCPIYALLGLNTRGPRATNGGL